MRLPKISIKHLFQGNYIRSVGDASIEIAPSARIRNCKIYIYPGSKLIIGDNCDLNNTEIYVYNGSIILDHDCILSGERYIPLSVIVENGRIDIAHHSKLACRKVWVRFGGKLAIGSYTNVNSGSEIRCDESVKIGSYNQISYNVRIWDTNTHTILSQGERRKVTEEYFPCFGYESGRPATKPVNIGDDCWIGENSTILKGSSIGNCCIVGYGTLIAGKNIADNNRVTSEINLRISQLKN